MDDHDGVPAARRARTAGETQSQTTARRSCRPHGARTTQNGDRLECLNPKTAVEITAKPYEQLLDNMPRLQGGSRAEWRRSQGIADDSADAAIQPAKAALEADANAPVDVEIIDNEDGPASDTDDQQSFAHPITPDDDDWPADGRTTLFDPMADTPSPFGLSPEVDGLMTLDEAVIRAARINNMGTAGHARLHRPQRALPPGRN